MNWLQKIMALCGADYVVLRIWDGDHLVKRVHWIGGRPFAAPYLSNTRGVLLPGGKFDGASFVHGWLPATARMNDVFAAALVNGEVG